MPKVIKNLRDNILITAKEELFKNGFKQFNMRSLAKLNKTAVGTIYNYFPSKEVLVASVILLDWQQSIKEIEEVSSSVPTVEKGIEKILISIDSFYSTYRDIFRSSGLKNIRTAYPEKYDMLINSIGDEVKKLLERFSIEYTEFEVSFIVANIFASVTNCWPYEQTIQILTKIVKEN